jgi:hypothetical protein
MNELQTLLRATTFAFLLTIAGACILFLLAALI